MQIPDYKIDSFRFGLLSQLKDKKQYPKGSASDSLNWLTRGDRIELRRGTHVIGTRNDGAGKIQGLGVIKKKDSTQVVIRKRGRKVESYDSGATSPDWVEAGSDVLPVAAINDDMAITPSESALSGYWGFLSSPNSDIYKVPAANPDSIVTLSSSSHRGYIKEKQGRLFLWNRKDTNGNSDKTSVYGSYIDKDELSDYTSVTAEVLGSGTGAQTAYSGTLGFKSGQPKRTCMYVTITDGTETFNDDGSGVLVGNLGGTGTINYATGAYSVTFNTAPVAGVNNITSNYYWEDSTSQGLADFSKSTPRTAGQGFVFPQPDGEMRNLFSIGETEYCLHTTRTRKLTLSQDDTDATNLIYRQKVGIPYWRAACETGDGIPYLDNTDEAAPAVRILTVAQDGTGQVLPESLSTYIDLQDYRFDKAVVYDWGEYLILACRTPENPENNVMFARFKDLGTWDKLDFPATVLETLNGSLIAGDGLTDNVYTLFSGLDDDDTIIPNQWTSGETDLDQEGSKRFYYLVVDGTIGPDQQAKVELSFDLAPFVEVGGEDVDGVHVYAIEGTGDYVDRTQQVYIGGPVMGSTVLGDGTEAEIEAYHFRRVIRVASDLFEYLRVRVSGQNVGWLSVNSFEFQDIRYKGRRVARRYVNAS